MAPEISTGVGCAWNEHTGINFTTDAVILVNTLGFGYACMKLSTHNCDVYTGLRGKC